MSLKIIIDKPSDKGNKFLCPDCAHCSSRRETEMREEYWCELNWGGAYGATTRIPFQVTECSKFQPKDLFDNFNILPEVLKKQAYYLYPSRERRGVLTFVDFDEFERRENE